MRNILLIFIVFGLIYSQKVNCQNITSDSSKVDCADKIDSICICKSLDEKIHTNSDLNQSDIILVVEEPAKFGNGDLNDFRIYIQDCIAKSSLKTFSKNDKVVIRFTIDIDGSLVDSELLRCNNSGLAREAIKCLSKSPKWIPARQSGKNVKQNFVIPIVNYKDNK